LLPCTGVLYEKEGKTILDIIKPSTAMGMVDNPDLRQTALEVETKLKQVFDSIK
jgi:hypothetical protein